MNQLQALKLADTIWVRKVQGYRIHCYELIDGVRQEVLIPSIDTKLMDSDVAAWRLAHKLSAAGGETADGLPVYTDIYLLDDLGQAVNYYATGAPLVLNPVSHP